MNVDNIKPSINSEELKYLGYDPLPEVSRSTAQLHFILR